MNEVLRHFTARDERVFFSEAPAHLVAALSELLLQTEAVILRARAEAYYAERY